MKLLLIFLWLASTLSYAQTSTDVKIIKIDTVCGTPDQLYYYLDKLQEKPMLQMISQRGTNEFSTVLFVNAKTQSYTIVEEISEKLYCVIGSGIELGVFSSPLESSPKKKNEDIRSHK